MRKEGWAGMQKRIVYKIVIWAVFVAAILLGFLAWQASRSASVVVDWTTASELDTVGFNLSRGDTPEGPFTQVNSELIPASSDPLTGSAYQYIDHNVYPGRVYYYQLEDIDTNGATTRHGPIEVKAQGGGRNESIYSLALMVTGIIMGIVLRMRASDKTN